MCAFKITSAQKIHVATANLERRNYQTGVILLYYGENRIIRNCYPYSVKFNKDETPESIANTLKSKIAAYDPYIYFEFKEGYDCKSAEGYLLKKGLSRMSIGGCQYANFSTETATANSGREPDGELIDYSKEDYVAKIPPAKINQLKSYFKEEHDKLLADGWVRFSSMYNALPYQYAQFSFGGRYDKSFTLILVADDTTAIGNVYEKGNGLEKQKLGPNKFMVYYDLYSPAEKRQFSAYVNSLNNANVSFGVIGYRKEPGFLNDFHSILEDAKKGFSSNKAREVKFENGNTKFQGKKTLGHLYTEVVFNTALAKWVYKVYTVWGDEDSDKIDNELKKILDEKENQGIYIVKRRESDNKNTLYTDVFDKEGNLLLNTEKRKDWTKEDKWTFYEQKR